ncbi:MAG: alpha/beta hydrolase family protein [Candidatus Rifleibacteriota bacterium]
MIQKTHKNFSNIPTLLLYKESPETAAKKGTIICCHGLDSSKDAWTHDLEAFVQAGFLIVAIDNVGHGERRYDDFSDRFDQNEQKKSDELIKVVKETAAEMPYLINALSNEKLVSKDKLGIFGVSLGGFIVYSSIRKNSEIRAVSSLLGSPEWWMKPDDIQSPHLHPQKFADIRLLAQTAEQDKLVPAQYGEKFHSKLQKLFNDYSERFAYKSFPESGHFMREVDWHEAINNSVEWFQKHLGP